MTNNIQDTFLNQVRKQNIPVTVFLMNGVQFKGFIKNFDNFVVVMEIDKKQSMIYKHALSTIIPAKNVTLFKDENEGQEKK